jgi:hypothetical protein
MKYLTEIIIVLLVGLLVFKAPVAVTEYANTILGKLGLLLVVLYITKNQGLLCGALSALVMIILIHHSFEGFKEGAACKNGGKKKNKNKKKGGVSVSKPDVRNIENNLQMGGELATANASVEK